MAVEEENNEFFAGYDAIMSLRKMGYRDSAMAVGELIDNSIQAHATEIEIVLTTEKSGDIRETEKIKTIAIIDNGDGMSSQELRNAMRLGKGTHMNDESGMGKFGVGLPQASINQALRVDAWSWKDGMDSFRHAYIDLTDRVWADGRDVLEPDKEPIPKEYIQFVKGRTSGTIIKWSEMDNIDWKKPKTIFKHTQNQIGRMYRYWLNDKSVSIKMITIKSNGNIQEKNEYVAIDPLFLMENAKSTEDSDEILPKKPLFTPYNEIEEEFDIKTSEGIKKTKVTLKFSMAHRDVWPGNLSITPGNTGYGKFTAANKGVSIVREGRELEFLENWDFKESKKPVHRWWGAEVSFSRDLDDIFGVTNNKQSATKLSRFATRPYESIADEFQLDYSKGSLDLDSLKESEPDTYIIVKIVTRVTDVINQMYDQIANLRTEKTDGNKRFTNDAITTYDEVAKSRMADPSTQSETDKIILETEKDRTAEILEELNKTDYGEETIDCILKDVNAGHRCSIIHADTDSTAFFSVERKGSQMILRLNTLHPMYTNLFGVLDDASEDEIDPIKLKETANKTLESIYIILEAWARMEDEAIHGMERERYREIRQKWGSILNVFAGKRKDN